MFAQWWFYIFLFLTIILSSFLFANPFDSFESELRDYIDSENNQNVELDPQILQLFQPDEEEESLRSFNGYSTVSSNIRLPSHISVTRLISTTVIKSSKVTKGGSSYLVKAKDTLSSIAKKYKTTVAHLKQINGLKSDVIRVGQVLKINGAVSQGSVVEGTVYKMRVFAMPVLNGKITSHFGYRRDPFNPNLKNFHSGLDLSAPVGTPIIASSDGVVEFTGRNGGYGNTIIIRHKDGYKTVYAHCSTITVSPGDHVKMGTVIGSVGRTGTATGAHLHFEVLHRGKFINPESALKKVEIVISKTSSSGKKS